VAAAAWRTVSTRGGTVGGSRAWPRIRPGPIPGGPPCSCVRPDHHPGRELHAGAQPSRRQERHRVTVAAGVDEPPVGARGLHGAQHRQDRRDPDAAGPNRYRGAGSVERRARTTRGDLGAAASPCTSREPPPPSAIRRRRSGSSRGRAGSPTASTGGTSPEGSTTSRCAPGRHAGSGPSTGHRVALSAQAHHVPGSCAPR